MRPQSISKQFLILLSAASIVVVGFAIGLTYQFARFSSAGRRLTLSLQQTFALNQDLRQGINEEVGVLSQQHQFETVDPDFAEKFGAINYELGEKQTQYLKLDIGLEERLAVEHIKSLQDEMAVQSMEIFGLLRQGQRDQALARLKRIDELGNRIDREFLTLNELQVRKLEQVLDRLDQSVRIGYFATFGFAAGLVAALAAFVLLLRRRVIQPLHSVLESAERIRKGDFSARAAVDRMDEIGQLGQGFNFMAETLEESYASLERKVEERTQQLQQLQQQLVQAAKMSAVGELVSGVAHELNNPLTVILGFTELGTMELAAGRGNDKEITLLEDIHFHAERCRRIVANLLQFARQREPRKEVIAINEVIEQALRLREHELDVVNIRLEREYDQSKPQICADPHAIQQIVLNMVNNAYDAIREAGREGVITVRTRASDGKIRIEFLDNGTGIKQPDRVFDPFYTTKEVGKGTGLGLSVCYGIVQDHGGEIRAENWEKGGRFVITLPVGDLRAIPQRVAGQPLTLPKSGEQAGGRALIVDDEATLLRLQIAFLRRIGIAAEGVSSGEDAVQYLGDHPVDLIISDVRMPGAMDGVQLYEWVRDHRPDLVKRFVFVSGDTVGMSTGDFFANAPVPCLQKPFQYEAYSRVVRQVIGS